MLASPQAFLLVMRDGDSRFTQPPLSMLSALPGSSGSYLAPAW